MVRTSTTTTSTDRPIDQSIKQRRPGGRGTEGETDVRLALARLLAPPPRARRSLDDDEVVDDDDENEDDEGAMI